MARIKRVLILGATGMLGSALYDVLKDGHKLVLSVRDKKKIRLLEKTYGGTHRHDIVSFDAGALYEDVIAKKELFRAVHARLLDGVGDVDYVINAIGIITPFALQHPALTLFINGSLPHILASVFGKKLIHITTDCAFNGTTGFPYDERSPKTPTDLYGLSKSIGEPENCLTLRTSIIGRELEGFAGLLEWFLRQGGNEVRGFREHYWNGITTKQFAKICKAIMAQPKRYPAQGIHHVFSTPISKLEMLRAFQKKYGTRCTILEDATTNVNRTLATTKPLNALLRVPSFRAMLNDL